MSLLLRSGAIIFLGGGGACVVPFLKFPPSVKTTSTPTSTTVTHNSGGEHSSLSSSTSSVDSSAQRASARQVQQTHNIAGESENCSFKLNEDKSSIESASSSVKYFAFSCDNSGRHEEVITTTWTIWLPESLLKETKNSLKEGMRVNIKTQTSYWTSGSDSSDYYKTTFDSNIFTVSPITVTWGGNVAWISGEDPVYKVTITVPTLENQEIYLKSKY